SNEEVPDNQTGTIACGQAFPLHRVLVQRARKHEVDLKTQCLQGFFAWRGPITSLHSLFVMHASRVHKMQRSAFTESCWPTARMTRSSLTRSAMKTACDSS